MSQPKGLQRSDARRDSRRPTGPYLIYSVVEQLGRDIVVGECPLESDIAFHVSIQSASAERVSLTSPTSKMKRKQARNR